MHQKVAHLKCNPDPACEKFEELKPIIVYQLSICPICASF